MKKLSILLLSILSACSSSDTQESTKTSTADQKLNIVATTGMIQDMVAQVAGENAEVIALMGPGVDPHLYTAAQSDLKILKTADVIFYNGLHLEGKLSDVLEKFSRKKDVFAVADCLSEEDIIHSDELNAHDPHIWFDMSLWAKTVQYIAEKLSQVDPDNQDTYRMNAEKLYKSLMVEHDDIKTRIQTIPESQRVLITAHDAFGYFGRAYDIKVVGFQGLSTVAKAGINQRIKLTNMIIEQNIKAIFVESTINPKSIEALIGDCAAKGHKVVIGGTLYSDAMGPKGSKAETYAGMVQHNVQTIVEGLK